MKKVIATRKEFLEKCQSVRCRRISDGLTFSASPEVLDEEPLKVGIDFPPELRARGGVISLRVINASHYVLE